MKQIAVYVDEQGNTTTFDEPGYVKVFYNEDGQWRMTKKIKLELNPSSSLKEVREQLAHIVKELDDCSIIVGERVYGLSYNVFEGMGFDIFEAEGKPESFLNDIIREIKEELLKAAKLEEDSCNQEKKSPIYKVKEGYYLVDLEAALKKDKTLTSKRLLIPFIEKASFINLEVICSHIPPWIEDITQKYPLKAEISKLENGSYKLVLIKSA